MDALSDLLRVTRLTGGVFLHAEFTDPWCLTTRVTPTDCGPFLPHGADIIPYHYVLEGTLRVKVAGQAPVELSAGQVVLLPRNDEHLLGGDLTLEPARGEDVVQRPSEHELAVVRLGGGGACTRLVCGFLGGDDLRQNPVVSNLPPLIRLDMGKSSAGEWVQSTFHYAAAEVAQGRLGAETVLTKLSELLFVEAVRQYVETLPPGQTGWLAGLQDPFVGRALALLHRRPAEPWTVDGLGRLVGLSRSALAERFVRVLGAAPMQYLTNWRMQLAAQELLRGEKSLAAIAESVGYESEAAFSRAFKRALGESPGAFRRDHTSRRTNR